MIEAKAKNQSRTQFFLIMVGKFSITVFLSTKVFKVKFLMTIRKQFFLNIMNVILKFYALAAMLITFRSDIAVMKPGRNS